MSSEIDKEKSRRRHLLVLARWLRRVGRTWVERARGGETVFLFLTAAFIGLLGGLGAIAFERGETLAPERVEPAYLRNNVAFTLAEQRARKR